MSFDNPTEPSFPAPPSTTSFSSLFHNLIDEGFTLDSSSSSSSKSSLTNLPKASSSTTLPNTSTTRPTPHAHHTLRQSSSTPRLPNALASCSSSTANDTTSTFSLNHATETQPHMHTSIPLGIGELRYHTHQQDLSRLTKQSASFANIRDAALNHSLSQLFDPSVASFSLRSGGSEATLSRWEAWFEPDYSFGSFEKGHTGYRGHHRKQRRKRQHMLAAYSSSSSIVHGIPGQSQDATSSFSSLPPPPTLPELNEEIFYNTALSVDRYRELAELMQNQKDASAGDRAVDPMDSESTLATSSWRSRVKAKLDRLRREANRDASICSSETSNSIYVGSTSHLEKQVDGTHPHSKKPWVARSSFLLFVLGFMFPPCWILGALYIGPSQRSLSPSGRQADLMWRRRSRIVLAIFLLLTSLVLILLMAFKPEAIGWRQIDRDRQAHIISFDDMASDAIPNHPTAPSPPTDETSPHK
ncbi:uncharacterized protein BYT42DRAFT_148827 [Radiomyces spectabilis]|uniref:uncharacterized protein n=1 Tax=Radiomyces spectabilis TaxID=64574 RepID=UPI00221FC1B4|nr:uncharacterized protein BYT42DRAFT_148827 [Radiomyces spectabilis]KAI8365981.1 hypothetical protein BYT42DRAFT_148827 [Radiomyces spectabilis]